MPCGSGGGEVPRTVAAGTLRVTPQAARLSGRPSRQGGRGKRAEPPSGCSGAQSAGHRVILHLPGVTRPPHPPGSPRRRLPKARARLLPQPLGHAASSGEQCPRTVAPGGSSEPGEPRPHPSLARRSPAQGAPGRRVQLHLQLLRNVRFPRGSEKKRVRIPASFREWGGGRVRRKCRPRHSAAGTKGRARLRGAWRADRQPGARWQREASGTVPERYVHLEGFQM